MKTRTAGTLSGCILWLLLICIISSCMIPMFMGVGSATSFSQIAIKTTGNLLCPEGTTPESQKYSTTIINENGHTQPAVGMKLHCVDQSGNVVKEDLVVYSFLWSGIFALVGLMISAVLAFALAAPAGALVAKFLNRRQKQDISTNIEPR